MVNSPDVGVVNVAAMRNSVDLPEPLTPMIDTTCPTLTDRSRSSRMVAAPYRLQTDSILSNGVSVVSCLSVSVAVMMTYQVGMRGVVRRIASPVADSFDWHEQLCAVPSCATSISQFEIAF